MRTLTRQELLSLKSDHANQPLKFAKEIASRYSHFNEYVLGDRTVFARIIENSRQIATLCIGYSIVDQIADIQFVDEAFGRKYAQFIETNVITLDHALDAFLLQYDTVIRNKDLQSQ